MLARAGILPTEEKAKKIWHNIQALIFMDYWQQKVQEETFQEFGRYLGVYWDQDLANSLFADTTEGSGGHRRKRISQMIYPLTLALNPGLIESIKKTFGAKYGIDAPDWAKDPKSEMVELYDEMPKEKFKDFLATFVPSSAKSSFNSMVGKLKSIGKWGRKK